MRLIQTIVVVLAISAAGIASAQDGGIILGLGLGGGAFTGTELGDNTDAGPAAEAEAGLQVTDYLAFMVNWQGSIHSGYDPLTSQGQVREPITLAFSTFGIGPRVYIPGGDKVRPYVDLKLGAAMLMVGMGGNMNNSRYGNNNDSGSYARGTWFAGGGAGVDYLVTPRTSIGGRAGYQYFTIPLRSLNQGYPLDNRVSSGKVDILMTVNYYFGGISAPMCMMHTDEHGHEENKGEPREPGGHGHGEK